MSPSPSDNEKPDPAKTAQAYLLAFEDIGFLREEELRPVRLQLELRKPELIQNREDIRSTVVVFGSARVPNENENDEVVRKAEEALAKDPENADLKRRKLIADNLAAKQKYYEEAKKFAGLATRASLKNGHRDYVVVTGGGPGIMEAANRGAYEAGGKNIGLKVTLPHEEKSNEYITPELCFQFHYFAIRKMHFLMRARALVVFPGGFGTFDELFETLTLIQTEKMEAVPIVLFGQEFWETAVNFEYLVDEGVISPEDLSLFTFSETAEDAWKFITTNEKYPEDHAFRPLETEGTP